MQRTLSKSTQDHTKNSSKTQSKKMRDGGTRAMISVSPMSEPVCDELEVQSTQQLNVSRDGRGEATLKIE